jgi:uncharacterized membrane protein
MGNVKIGLMLKLILGYVASALFAILLISGLILLCIALPDPEQFKGANEMRDVFAFNGTLTIVGLVGILVLRGFYRHHRKFSSVLLVTLTASAVACGFACATIAGESKPPILFAVGSIVFTVVMFFGGMLGGLLLYKRHPNI